MNTHRLTVNICAPYDIQLICLDSECVSDMSLFDIIFKYSEYELCLKIYCSSIILNAVNNNSHPHAWSYCFIFTSYLIFWSWKRRVIYWLYCKPQRCNVILIHGLLLMLYFMINALHGALVCEVSTNQYIELIFSDLFNVFLISKLILYININFMFSILF